MLVKESDKPYLPRGETGITQDVGPSAAHPAALIRAGGNPRALITSHDVRLHGESIISESIRSACCWFPAREPLLALFSFGTGTVSRWASQAYKG